MTHPRRASEADRPSNDTAVTTIELTSADDGRSLRATPGDEIVVLLAENATTGYRWHGQVHGEAVALEADGYRPSPPPESSELVFGRGGQRVFRFDVLTVGSAVLDLKLWREWEGESSVLERVSVTVEATSQR
jgi:inhibitor of cysteine peptidase